MFAEADKPTLSFLYPFPSTKNNITTLVFDYTGFIKTLSMDVLDIKSLYPPTKSVIMNPSPWALATFPEYPVVKIPVSPIIAEREVPDMLDVLTHLQRFWAQPDGELTPSTRVTIKDPVLARAVVFQASTNDKRTILGIASSGLYVLKESDSFPDATFPENTLYIVKITEPSYFQRCIKVPELEFDMLVKRCLSSRAMKSYLYTTTPSAPLTKKFVERIPAKSAMALITYGAQLAGKDISQEQIAESIDITNDGYLANMPTFRPSDSFQIRGGPITKLLIAAMNMSDNKRIPVDSFLETLYKKLKIRMSEDSLAILLKELNGFTIYQGNIIVYFV